MPVEAQASLRDSLKAPQPVERVLEARSKILSLAYTLAAQGLISVKRKNTSQLI